jgi:hypothetical protein
MTEPRLWVSVPITPAGAQQVELERNVRKPGTEIGVMTRVPRLDCVQPFMLQPLEEGPGAPFLQVGHRHHAPGGMHNLGHGVKRRQRFFNERRSAAADETVKGIAGIFGAAMPNDRPRNVGPAHRPAGRFLQHGFKWSLYAQFLEPLHHLPRAAHAICTAALQERVQLGRFRREKVAQHMHFSPCRGHGELAACYHPNLMTFAGGHRLRNARQRVVVREGNTVKTRGLGSLNDTLRSDLAIRGRGVDMKIDRGSGLMVRAGRQRPYPISGAVQDG